MNKNKFKTLIALLLVMFTSVSCANNDPKDEYILKENEILDGSNRVVSIPEDPSSATAASVYAVATPFFLALGMSDRVKACNTKKDFIRNNNEYLNASDNVGNGDVDLEKLARINPTVLIHRSNDSRTVEKVSELGIAVVTIKVENMDDVILTLNNLGKYFGCQNNANTAINWINNEFTYIDNLVNSIPLEERKTALVMGGQLGRVAGNDMLQTWMIEKAGGIPVCDEGYNHNWINVGLEKVFSWNPEYIFCTSSAVRDYTINEIYSTPSWSAMKSCINQNIYVIPSSNDSWDMPGLSPVLGVLYMIRMMYPSYLSLQEFKSHIDAYYTFMFGKTFSSQELGYDIF